MEKPCFQVEFIGIIFPIDLWNFIYTNHRREVSQYKSIDFQYSAPLINSWQHHWHVDKPHEPGSYFMSPGLNRRHKTWKLFFRGALPLAAGLLNFKIWIVAFASFCIILLWSEATISVVHGRSSASYISQSTWHFWKPGTDCKLQNGTCV